MPLFRQFGIYENLRTSGYFFIFRKEEGFRYSVRQKYQQARMMLYEQLKKKILSMKQKGYSQDSIIDFMMENAESEEDMTRIENAMDKLEQIEYNDKEDDDFDDEDQNSKKSKKDDKNSHVDDALVSFLKQIGNYPVLKHNELTKLFKEYHDEHTSIRRKKQIRNQILTSNLKLVVSIAKNYHCVSLTTMDLIQEGTSGMMKAIEKFDETKGFHFSTYATHWVRQSITRHIAEQGRIIHVPVHMSDQIARLKRLKTEFFTEHQREATLSETAKMMGLSVSKVKEIEMASLETVSLDTPISNDDNEGTIEDIIADLNALSVNKRLDNEDLRKRLEIAIQSLPPREAAVIIARYPMDGSQPKTLEDIGKELHITRERVRQIEIRALNKLQSNSRGRLLKD